MMQQPDLTPYDTGARCEPKPWLPYGTKVTPITPAENFGKVDFDDDCCDTVAVVHVERDDEGIFTVHVQPLVDQSEVRVELHLESGVRTLFSSEQP